MNAVATEAYRLTGCRDYARVDLRVDEQGSIFVLEVNANPDLVPTAGLARMLTADGIGYAQFAQQLVQTAAGRKAEGGRQKAESRSQNSHIVLRAIGKDDRPALVELTCACGAFREDEVAVADELICEAQREGSSGDYQVLIAEDGGKILGWACYGLGPMTDATFNLYWIVVSPDEQRRGIGGQLLEEVERRVCAAAGRWLLAETSSTAAYESTRAFYGRRGYRLLGEIGDFYRIGDGRITIGKRFDR